MQRPTARSSMSAWHAYLQQLDAAPRLRRDRMADSRHFLTIVQAVEERLGCSCQYEVGASLQDEAVYGSLLLPRHVLVEDYLAWLRASETGDLVTIWDWDVAVKPDQLALIVSTVTTLGLLYVPTRVLDTPYSGRLQGFEPYTWSERLFGYCDPPAEI